MRGNDWDQETLGIVLEGVMFLGRGLVALALFAVTLAGLAGSMQTPTSQRKVGPHLAGCKDAKVRCGRLSPAALKRASAAQRAAARRYAARRR